MRRVVLFLTSLVLLSMMASCELFSPPVPEGKMHILVYGNNYGTSAYRIIGESNYYVSSLTGTVNDAVQVGNALMDLAKKSGMDTDIMYLLSDVSTKGSENCLIGNRHVNTVSPIIGLPDSELVHDTSLASFRSAISSIASISEPEDTTVVFFSGHGFYPHKGSMTSYGADLRDETSFLVCDNDYTQFEFYYADDFISDLSVIKGAVVVLADSCFSGGFVESGYVSVDKDEYIGIDENSLFFMSDRICESSSTFVLAASRYYEESFENDVRWHGYFTTALLEALGWDEGDGVNDIPCLSEPACLENNRVTFNGMARYIISNDGKSSQHPSLNGGSNDVILFDF